MAMGQQDLFPLWDGSVEMAQNLMLFTMCSVPIMLFPKPFILLYQHNQTKKARDGNFPMNDDEELPAWATEVVDRTSEGFFKDGVWQSATTMAREKEEHQRGSVFDDSA
eukprot:g8544.t1